MNSEAYMATAPAQDAIEYHQKVFHKSFGDDLSPYQGWPDDEKDKLWNDLYASMFIRISLANY